MLPQWEYDAQKVLYIVSPLLYNIDTLDDKDLPLCVPNGLETAIHWIQWRHCSCKKWRTHLVKATRDILDVVFVQKLFCSVYYCLSVHIFFEVAEKNYLIWDFFQRSIWLQIKARNRKAIWFCNAACSQLVRKRWRGSVGVMAAKHLRSAVINMDITNWSRF